MRSDLFVVRFSQLGELNSSLGASEPKYTLEVIYFTHMGPWERLLNTPDAEALVNFTEFKAQSEGPFKAQCPEPTGWESLTSLLVTGDRRWKFPTA